MRMTYRINSTKADPMTVNDFLNLNLMEWTALRQALQMLGFQVVMEPLRDSRDEVAPSITDDLTASARTGEWCIQFGPDMNHFNLNDHRPTKIDWIKAFRSILGLGIKEAKELFEEPFDKGHPTVVVRSLDKDYLTRVHFSLVEQIVGTAYRDRIAEIIRMLRVVPL